MVDGQEAPPITLEEFLHPTPPTKAPILTAKEPDINQRGYYFSSGEVSEDLQEAMQAVGRMEKPGGKQDGSYFIIVQGDRKYVVSCKHCFLSFDRQNPTTLDQFAIALPSGKRIALRGENIVQIPPEYNDVVGKDIIVIEITDPDGTLPALKLAETKPGERVTAFSIGYPSAYLQMRPDIHGPVTSVGTTFPYRNSLLSNGRVEAGNSGGPLLNANLEVIGVNYRQTDRYPDRTRQAEDHNHVTSHAAPTAQLKSILAQKSI